MRPLCIAHGSNCVDGHLASWVVHRAVGGEVDITYESYQRPPPDAAGRDVIIVDFSYPRAVLEEMARSARSVLILDHHKSAAEDLKNIWHAPSFSAWRHSAWVDPKMSQSTRLAALFDISRSGAGITWDYFFPSHPRPWFVDLVEDRDLWKFTDDRSRPFHAAVTSYPLSFKMWDKIDETHQ